MTSSISQCGLVRLLIAIAVLLAVTPGMSEVVEAGVHMVAHRDLPHHGAERDRGCGEHTCTPLAHHCSCHMTMSAQPAARDASHRPLRRAEPVGRFAPRPVFGRPCDPPALRPPIA